jgi:DNA polymerase IV (DinB-like DNA polymerase)
MARIIMLVDMDAFYTSCEQVRNPKYKGKPVAVGADPKEGKGRGVVAAASYEARKFGIHSAMPISIAYRKCPSCIFLPVDMEQYVEVSARIMKHIRKYADAFEQVSVDEAYLDVSSQGTYEKARELARKIKKEILAKEKLTCSIGIGPNKLIAKMASSKNKPNGLTLVAPSGIQKFLDPQDVDALYGVGPKTTAVLQKLNILTIKDLSKISVKRLEDYFGTVFAHYLHEASHGIDESPVSEGHVPKSSGRHFTFEKDTDDKELIYKTMDEMIDDAFSQLRKEGFKTYKTITITVRYEDFETHTKAHTMIDKAAESEQAKNVAKSLLNEFLRKGKKIRLIGVSLSKFT